MEPTLKIDRIDIKNFRCFEDVSLILDPRLTVIVALNGQGKTSLLDAIKVALWPFVANFDLGSTTNDVTGIRIDDVFREKVTSHQMEWRLPATIECNGTMHLQRFVVERAWLDAIPTPSDSSDALYVDIPWLGNRFRDSVKKNTKTRNVLFLHAPNLHQYAETLEKRIFTNSLITPVDLPLLAYYGTGRLWSQGKTAGKPPKSENESFSRTFAYRDCLDPSSSYKHFAQWYTRIFKALRDGQIRAIEKKQDMETDLPDGLLAPVLAVQRAIDTILTRHTGWHSLQYSAGQQDLILEHAEHGELKVSQLSDGIRNMLALAGDIAYRCYQLNAHFGDQAALLTHGIVMIDEVDMHLHPEWQQTVLPDLQQAFPNIQFIVTTHSPQVLTSVEAHCIRRLDWERDDESGRKRLVVRTVSQQTLGVGSADVLAEVMEIDPVPDVEPARQLSRYQALIQQNLHDSDEGKMLRSELERHFGPQHPLILNCERLLRLQTFKRQLPPREKADAQT